METKELFKKAYEGSYYTIIGCGGSLDEWKEGLGNLFEKEGIGRPREFYDFTGKDMNEEYNLTGNNRYADDLVFICFPHDGLNVQKLAIFRLLARDHWFDDIVDNNARREAEMHPEPEDE